MIARQQAPQSWTVARLLAWTEEFFRSRGIDSPRLDAELLLAEALGCSRVELYTGFQRPVEEEERAAYRQLVERRGRREPVAYILGRREFYSLMLEVTPDVLVPRPETEHVVDAVLAELVGADRAHEVDVEGAEAALDEDEAPPERPAAARRLLDLGTGSGNIAIAVLASAPAVLADAVDSSGAALAVASRNARAHGVDRRLRLLEGDLFDALPPGAGPYGVIASNPPYVAASEMASLMPEVRQHEPAGALVDGRSPDGDGLGYYRDIAATALRHLVPGGLLVLEVGESQADAVVTIAERAGLQRPRVDRDGGGVERVVSVRAPDCG